MQHAAKPVPTNNTKVIAALCFLNKKWYCRIVVIHAMNLRVFCFKKYKLIQSSLCWLLL